MGECFACCEACCVSVAAAGFGRRFGACACFVSRESKVHDSGFALVLSCMLDVYRHAYTCMNM